MKNRPADWLTDWMDCRWKNVEKLLIIPQTHRQNQRGELINDGKCQRRQKTRRQSDGISGWMAVEIVDWLTDWETITQQGTDEKFSVFGQQGMRDLNKCIWIGIGEQRQREMSINCWYACPSVNCWFCLEINPDGTPRDYSEYLLWKVETILILVLSTAVSCRVARRDHMV